MISKFLSLGVLTACALWSADFTVPQGTQSGTVVYPATGSYGNVSTVSGSDGTTVFAAGSNVTIYASNQIVLSPGFTAVAGSTFYAQLYNPPVITAAASASPSTVTGTTTTLSLLGTDDLGEPSLRYTWSTVSGPGAVTFSGTNGTNAGKSLTATFAAAGNYVLRGEVRDGVNLAATSDVAVTVQSTLTTVSITPATASVSVLETVTFVASAKDQFHAAMGGVTPTWTTGGGSITTGGIFTPVTTPGGPFTVRATAGTVSATAQVTITGYQVPAVTISIPASETRYREINEAGAITTTITSLWQGTTNRVAERRVSIPAVPTNQHGANTAVEVITTFDGWGRPRWSKDADGYISYVAYDDPTGAVVRTISDVDTTKTGDFTALPAGWSSPADGKRHLKTDVVVDNLGRPLLSTDPSGVATAYAYNDAAFEMRTYPGWKSSTGTVTGPVRVVREHRGLNFREILSANVQPSPSNGLPTGQEAITGASITSLTRELLDENYRVKYQDAYVSLSGQTYSTATDVVGSAGTNFYRTEFSYDLRGRKNRTKEASGTISRVEYDAMSRPVSRWTGVGTADSVSWSPATPGTMAKVQTLEYDATYDTAGTPTFSTGNGFLTRMQTWSGSTSYSTYQSFDFRGRLVTTCGPDGVLTATTYDNLDRAIQVDTYGNGTPGATSSPALRGRSVTSYDERGHVFESRVYGADQASTTNTIIGNYLLTKVWYNARGLPVKTASPSGLLTKVVYDGLGRVVRTSRSIDAAETAYADALTRTNDTVIDAVTTQYNAVGQPILVTTLQRKDNDTTTTGDLTPANAYTTAAVSWYDGAHRSVATADYGRDASRLVYSAGGALQAGADGVPTVAAGLPPIPSAGETSYRVATTAYDTAGRPYRTTNPLGQITQTTYDLLGQPLTVVENYVDGTPSVDETDTDRVTTIAYRAEGLVKTRTARVPDGTAVVDQTTTYLYEAAVSGRLVTSVIAPDSSDTTSSGVDQVKMTYDALGRVVTSTDQRGVTHTYSYDNAGRKRSDQVTAAGATVDTTVKRIEWAYDDQGRVTTVSSYDAVTGGTILDQVQTTYTPYGQVASSAQEHAGGSVGGGTPRVSYGWSDGGTASSEVQASFVRLTSITYPNQARTVYPRYPATGIGAALNRVADIAEDPSGVTKLADYTYLGASTPVRMTLPATGNLVLDYGSGGTYGSLDAFGRPTTHAWTQGGGTVVDGWAMTYDNLSNRTSRRPTWSGVPAGREESFTFDGLNRLAKVNRGTLSSGTISDANAAWQQSWTLNASGTWRSFVQDTDGAGAGAATTQIRQHNKANEIDLDGSHRVGVSIVGEPTLVAPTYDAAGNVSSGPMANNGTTRHHYTWDAWNRLVQVKADSTLTPGTPGAVVATYRYDGLGRRIRTTTIVGATTTTDDIYYNESWQELEIRRNGQGVAYEQYVWDPRYIDAPLRRYRSPGNTGTLTETVGFLQDTTWNVTAVVNPSGAVIERYRYDPYGKRTVCDAAGNVLAASLYDIRIGFTGRRIDTEAGLMYFRNRYYHTDLGSFISRDPAGYVDGLNLYCGYFVANGMDPMGLSCEEKNWLEKAWNKVGQTVDYLTDQDAARERLRRAAANDERSIATQAVSAYARDVKDGIKESYNNAAVAASYARGADYSTFKGWGEGLVAVGAIGIYVADGALSVLPGKASVTETKAAIRQAERAAEIAERAAAKSGTKVDSVIQETLQGKGNLTSKHTLDATEALNAGEQFVGKGYTEIGKPGSGVFRSADGTRQFRIDDNSIRGNHAPGVPHVHLETYAPGSTKPTANNHIPFND